MSKKGISRRRFLKNIGLTGGAAILASTLPWSKMFSSEETIEPIASVQAVPATLKKLTPYVDALVIPPALPITTTFPLYDYYEISIAQATAHKFHRDLPAVTTQSYFGGWTLPTGFFYLGPTIVATKGRPIQVKFTNNLPRLQHLIDGAMDYTIMGTTDPNSLGGMTPWTDEHRVAVHLHGGKTNVIHDGGPRDWFSPNGSAQANPYPEGSAIDPLLTGSHTYEYPNDQAAAMMWYHDHAWGITRFNPFLGQAAAYVLRDNYENDLINGTNNAGNNSALQTLPSGAYEVPIVLQDRLFNLATGAMIYPVANNPVGAAHPLWIPEYFGDTPVVNGKAYPFLNVEPRRYRFRFLNGSQARFFNIWFQGPSANNLPIWVTGSEQGFLPTPMMVNTLLLAPGERFDTIFDFTGIKNGTIMTLKNNAKAPYPGGRGGEIPEIMQFRVVTPLTGTDATTLPASLTLPPIAPALTPPLTGWREIVLSEIMDPVTKGPMEALLDGLHFVDSAPPNLPLFTEANGATNVWQFINTTGDAHPMHTHLVPFKVVDRQPFDAKGFLAAWNTWIAAGGGNISTRPTTPGRPLINNFLTVGAAYPPAPEETGWKDTAKAYPGEVLRIIAKFDLYTSAPSGLNRYVCHCHILEHEENDMMFYFGVQK